MTMTAHLAAFSAIPSVRLKKEELAADTQSLLPPQDVELEALVAALTFGKPLAVTFDQVEAAMVVAGYNPFEASDLYQTIVETLSSDRSLWLKHWSRSSSGLMRIPPP